MTTDNPKRTQAQRPKEQGQETPAQELGSKVQEAVDEYIKIRAALMTPTNAAPLPREQRWNLPELNETAEPDN